MIKNEPLRLHADFDQRALILAQDADWVSSPSAGVDRIMFDRLDGEVARATSIVPDRKRW